jgi:hypothetical protein
VGDEPKGEVLAEADAIELRLTPGRFEQPHGDDHVGLDDEVPSDESWENRAVAVDWEITKQTAVVYAVMVPLTLILSLVSHHAEPFLGALAAAAIFVPFTAFLDWWYWHD